MLARCLGTLFYKASGPGVLAALRPASAMLHAGPISSLAPPPWHPFSFAEANNRLRERRNFSSAPFLDKDDSSKVTPEQHVDLAKLDVDGVYHFALKHDLSAGNAGILKRHEIDGDALLNVTKEELVEWGMRIGSARRLIDAVEALKNLAHTFVNRDHEIARLFALNVSNNRNTGSSEFQSFRFGFSMHLYGAGNTALGDAYLGQLKTKSVRNAVEKQLKTMPDWGGRRMTASLLQDGLNQLDEMEEERVVRVAINANGTFDETMDELKGALDLVMLEKSDLHSPSYYDNHSRLQVICKEHPVFLFIDHSGRLPDLEFRKLRRWLAHLYHGQERHSPLHVYVCGRPSIRDKARANVSPVGSELLLPQALGPLDVRHIAKADFNASEDMLSMDVCGEIAKVTGGIPRMIRYMLEAVLPPSPDVPITTDLVCQTALVVAKERSKGDHILLDQEEGLLAFARFAAIQELGYELDLNPGSSDDYDYDPLAQLVSFLPVMTERQESSGLYRIRCCTLFFTALRDQLSRLDASKIVLDDPRPASERGDEQQHQLLAYLQRQLMLRLLAERAPGGGADGSPLTTSLLEWLPVLFRCEDGAENRNALLTEAVWDATESDVKNLLARPLRAYFKPRQLEEGSAENGHTVTPDNLWTALDSLVGPEQTAAVMVMTSDQSHLPGTFLHLPADSGPLRLVTFKAKCNDKKSYNVSRTWIGISDLSDAVEKLPRDMPPGTRQLLVLVAESFSRALRDGVGEQMLVLTKAKEGTQVISKGRVIPSTLQRGDEKLVADDVLDVERTLLEELAPSLELLPDGATVAVMRAQQFRGSYGHDHDDAA